MHVHSSRPSGRPSGDPIPVTGGPFSRRQKLVGYVALTKPRIIELLLVTTVPTMFVAERGVPSIWLMVATMVGGTLAAGGANAVNMVVDRDIDSLMERTMHRPLVRGVMSPRAALTFAVVIEVVAFVWLFATVNLLSAALAASATFFYVFVYTLWLKRTTTQNIVIGGAAGAVPVLVGWSAVTNSLAWSPVILFLLIFFWTPPHFWALAIKYRDDYEAASVPMLPSVVSIEETVRKMAFYTVVLVVLTVVFSPVADMGAVYLVSALILGAVFGVMVEAVRRRPTEQTAMRLFSFSITYLTLLFGAMVIDVLV
ncbi:MAG: heme o synthase [Acidimicrobiales bacterium]|nr:heme o synthase [Acidimicrobiales bacterium]MDP6288389.1 heme o synthase [Acidimicrobiales bacterium]MDP6912152.1 heme o synthase [Acidimicrobiales bacterium]HJP24683.1 heme o synthase [Acidimicrobiales bacterium]